MLFLLCFLLFFIGLFFGSFYLVIIDRLPKGQSPFHGRSHCTHCRHVLAWYDLIPVISFLLLSGKCRYCHGPLSYYYPGVEIVTGILFAAAPLIIHSNDVFLSVTYVYHLLYLLFTLSVLLLIFFSDLRYGIVPFMVVLPSIFITGIYLVTVPHLLLNHLLSAFGAGLFFLFLHLITRGRGMGFGDVVLVFYLGLLLGFPQVGIALYLAFLTGAVISLILVLTGLKKLKGGTVPFGPFLIVAAFMSIVWGDVLGRYIMSLFLR